MTYRKIVNFLIFIVSILSVNLITSVLGEYLMRYKHYDSPVKVTVMGMVITVFVLYPAFNWMDDLSEKLTKKLFVAGTNAGGKFLGLVWAFGAALIVLFCCYLYLWFRISIWSLAWKQIH